MKLAIYRPALVMLIVALTPTPSAHAQGVETRTSSVTGAAIDTGVLADAPDAGLGAIERLYLGGDIGEARLRIEALMCAKAVLSWTCETPKPPPSTSNQTASPARPVLDQATLAKAVFYVLWVGSDVDGNPVVRRVMFPSAPQRPYAIDLPGIGTPASSVTVYEVFLANDSRVRLVSSYRSTKVDNPVASQIPAFASQVLSPVFVLAGALAHALPHEPAALTVEVKAPDVWLTVSKVSLPYARASIAVTSRGQVGVTTDGLQQAVNTLLGQVRFDTASGSVVAQTFAAALAEAVPQVAVACQAQLLWADCLDAFDAAFTKARPSAAGTDGEAVKAVEAKFRSFVDGLPKTVNTDFTLSNTPLSHYSFGAMAGGIALSGSPNRQRVKLDTTNKLAADPLPRTLTVLKVNISVPGYDAAAPRATAAERSQWFVGAIVTPDLGIASGYTLEMIKGLSLDVGVGATFGRGLRAGDQIGLAPTDSLKPFALSTAPVFFLGTSVAFSAK